MKFFCFLWQHHNSCFKTVPALHKPRVNDYYLTVTALSRKIFTSQSVKPPAALPPHQQYVRIVLPQNFLHYPTTTITTTQELMPIMQTTYPVQNSSYLLLFEFRSHVTFRHTMELFSDSDRLKLDVVEYR